MFDAVRRFVRDDRKRVTTLAVAAVGWGLATLTLVHKDLHREIGQMYDHRETVEYELRGAEERLRMARRDTEKERQRLRDLAMDSPPFVGARVSTPDQG